MTSKKKKNIASEESDNELNKFSYDLKVPKERVAVLIGKKGEIKRNIEDATECKLDVDSKEGDVIITGNDSIGVYDAREVVRAIARGFNPDIANFLLKHDYMLDVIDLRDYAPTKNAQIRLKGRVIGTEGKSRKVIEELTQTHISVYGKTISIIGEITNVALAKNAVEKLLKGAMHSAVYRDLEKKRKEMKLKHIEESFNIDKA